MSADLDLSRRAVAAGWKWQAGAISVDGYRVTDVDTDGVPCAWTYTDGEHFAKHSGCYGVQGSCVYFWGFQLPDFRAPATRGVLLQQVRERWDDPWLCVAWTGVIWICVDRHGIGLVPPCRADSETAALVAALEAAPGRK